MTPLDRRLWANALAISTYARAEGLVAESLLGGEHLVADPDVCFAVGFLAGVAADRGEDVVELYRRALGTPVKKDPQPFERRLRLA